MGGSVHVTTAAPSAFPSSFPSSFPSPSPSSVPSNFISTSPSKGPSANDRKAGGSRVEQLSTSLTQSSNLSVDELEELITLLQGLMASQKSSPTMAPTVSSKTQDIYALLASLLGNP